MSKRNTPELKAAVVLLVETDNYARLINEIRKIVENWDVHPMAYDGHLEPLNALIEIGLESAEVFERIIAIIEAKRKVIPAVRRVDYQRTLMQERRARVAKALELHERTTGKVIKNATERTMLTSQLQKRWSRAQGEFLKAKGTLSWKERNAARQEFWAEVDAKLDANLKSQRANTPPPPLKEANLARQPA